MQLLSAHNAIGWRGLRGSKYTAFWRGRTVSERQKQNAGRLAVLRRLATINQRISCIQLISWDCLIPVWHLDVEAALLL